MDTIQDNDLTYATQGKAIFIERFGVRPTHRHPPTVYRAARDGCRQVLEALAQPGRPGDPHKEALAALRGVTRGLLQDLRCGFARSMSTGDLAAYVLGTSAVPAVLRVRARRTQQTPASRSSR